MKTARLFISGMVQAVGFRYFVRSSAKQNNIKGWVRNTGDGRVEAMVQGSQKDIEELIEICRKGPFLSQVKDVEVMWEESPQEFSDFQIIAD